MPYGTGWAPPLTWGPEYDLEGNSGGDRSPYTVSCESQSEAPSSYTIRVRYVTADGIETVTEAAGEGSTSITVPSGSGVGTDKISFQSHSVGQVIQYTW